MLVLCKKQERGSITQDFKRARLGCQHSIGLIQATEGHGASDSETFTTSPAAAICAFRCHSTMLTPWFRSYHWRNSVSQCTSDLREQQGDNARRQRADHPPKVGGLGRAEVDAAGR